jgi:hypothetical protein
MMQHLRRRCLFLAVVLLVVPSALFAQCGVERWSVKTGTDADVNKVNLNSPSSTTIAALRSPAAPSPIPANNRVSPWETTEWILNATLTQYKLESDSDYHLVLRDAGGLTMIVEIPSPSCVGAGSPFLAGITNARNQFNARFTATTSFQTANISVQIKGVGMFDFLHGQTGVAPNGIELHPVLDIIFNPGNPTPDFAVSASPTSVSVAQGGSKTTTISTTVSGGFNSAVSLSASGLPSGVTASFSPSSIAAPGSGSSTLTFTASSTAALGTSTVTINATGGGKSHSTTLSLTVGSGGTTTTQLLGNPGFENGSTSTAPWTLTSGVINNSASEPPHNGAWDAWMNGYGVSHTDTAVQAVTIPSAATAATLSFFLHIDSAETSTTTAFDTLTVQVRNSSGTVLSTLATFSNLNQATGYQQKTFNLLSFKGQTIQIFFKGVEDSTLQTSFVLDDVNLNVTQ